MKYLFTNILGSFVFDNQFNLVEEIKFKGIEEYNKQKEVIARLKKKYKDGREVPQEKLRKVLVFFKDKKYFDRFYTLNLKRSKQGIKESFSADDLIIQTISNIEELTRAGNILMKRLREWYAWYLPEFSKLTENNEWFAGQVVAKNKKELMKEIKAKESMGAELSAEDVEEIKSLGKVILGLYRLKKKYEKYLGEIMSKYCPNLLELAGVTIGAKLIELGKGLKHLALLPASTVQLLGAEKALFRHIKTKSPAPKHGIIINHSLVQGSRKSEKGKAARRLADKLSLCARLDFFKGGFKAKEYKKELEEKLG